MRMIAGSIVFLGAVALLALANYRAFQMASYPHEDGVYGIGLLAFAIGGLALFMVISALVEEYKRPARDRSTQS